MYYFLGLENLDINAGYDTEVGMVLHVASRYRRTKTVHKILKAGGHVTSLDREGLTALQTAAEHAMWRLSSYF